LGQKEEWGSKTGFGFLAPMIAKSIIYLQNRETKNTVLLSEFTMRNVRKDWPRKYIDFNGLFWNSGCWLAESILCRFCHLNNHDLSIKAPNPYRYRYGLQTLRGQILNIWIIQTTRNTITQSKPWIEEKTDFIGQIWKGSTNQMLRFRIF
jgi:hypothetical protein